jgi:hypothetical protein
MNKINLSDVRAICTRYIGREITPSIFSETNEVRIEWTAFGENIDGYRRITYSDFDDQVEISIQCYEHNDSLNGIHIVFILNNHPDSSKIIVTSDVIDEANYVRLVINSDAVKEFRFALDLFSQLNIL